MWFRSDLRTADNTALAAAARERVGSGAGGGEGGVIGVYVITPGQWRDHDWAAVKVEFVLRTLAALSRDLAALNIPLLIRSVDRFTGVPRLLVNLAREHGCGRVHFNREYEVNEAARDEAVGAAFEKAGLGVHMHHDQTVLAPDELATQAGNFYTVFGAFRRSWVKRLEETGQGQAGPALRAAPAKQAGTGVEPDAPPARVPGFESGVDPGLWPAGERAAIDRLHAFVEHKIEDYDQARDVPILAMTSTLSPYLACGAISVRQCLAEAMAANGGTLDNPKRPGATRWISELVWREFYRHVLVGFPRVSMNRAFQPGTGKVRWRDDPEGFKAWCEGRTGFPIVDAGMRQLRATGWMHNRLRMITAMFLTKDLLIDWRLGERFFMQNLVDGDLANNNGGWQWSASTGTDAAPYFRVFNPTSQSKKVDPDGEFIRRWVPELAKVEGKAVHDPSELSELARARLGYPAPIVDHAKARVRVIEAFEAARR